MKKVQSTAAKRKTLRSFIAIELPEAARSVLAQVQQELKAYRADVRWVRPENIHLTLKFLGNVEAPRIEGIGEIIKEISGRYSAFHLEIKGMGVFPDARSPRVLWISINGSKTLGEIQREIDDRLISLGFEREKRTFTAHLTLARFRSKTGKEDLVKAMREREGQTLGTVKVRSIALMKSDLHPAGAVYTKIQEFFLRDPAEHTDNQETPGGGRDVQQGSN